MVGRPLLADSSLKYPAEIGPECVKTLSHLGCLSPVFLGEAVSQANSRDQRQ